MNQEESLVKLYKSMTTAEIEHRLATCDLLQLARGVAENELQKRQARSALVGATVAVPSLIPTDSVPQRFAEQAEQASVPLKTPKALFLALAFGAFAMGATALIAYDKLFMVASVVIALWCAIFAKAFPIAGRIVGGLLIMVAIGLVIWYVMHPPFKDLEMVVVPIFLFPAAFFAGAIGYSMVRMSYDNRSWESVFKEISEAQRKAHKT